VIIIVLFLINPIAQTNKLSFEKNKISAGAEYSQYLNRLINSGNADVVRYNGTTLQLNKTNDNNSITTVEGINFDEDALNGGFYHIPPDPSGAAGPGHLVSVVNTSIEWFTKAGASQHSESLASFFSSLSPLTGTFDPKVIYDQYNSRFVIVTLEKTDVAQGDPTNTSRIFIAVSQTSDPNSGWYLTQVDSKINISGTDTWADYPGFATGTDAIYITLNMFTFGSNSNLGARLWIIAKTPFYSGGVASVTIHNPYPGGQETTYQPAHMFGTPQSNVGTFLVSYSGLSDGTNEYINVVRIDDPLGTPTFNFQEFTVGNIDNTASFPFPDAPQFGASKEINTNDRRTLNAVWRNNSMYVTTTVIPPSGADAGQVTAHWFNINTNTLSALSLTDQGDIGGESIATGCYTFFPSITINSSGDAVIGFSASASTIYPGCYYTGRLSSDPAGFTITPDAVKAGLDYYVRTFTTGSVGRNRWGDYTGACVDPSDDQTFYVFNEYALTRGTILGGEDGRWGTAFGVIPVSLLPVELTSFTASLENNGIHLDWTTKTEINNYGFDVERSFLNKNNWGKIGFVQGSGNSNSPKEYSFKDGEIISGQYAYRLKQIDNDGTFDFSEIVEIDAGEFPGDYVLEQNYPNPFNPATKIKFAIKSSQNVKLNVYTVLGDLVKTLFNGKAESNRVYSFEFNGESLSSGIYIYRLESGSFSESHKMLMLK
jgi:Secretion system C-terminal sorting domain